MTNWLDSSRKKKKEDAKKIRNDREVATGTTEIQKIITDYYEKLYANNWDSLEEMETFLETCNLPRLN